MRKDPLEPIKTHKGVFNKIIHLMDSNGSLLILVGPCEFSWVLMVPYRSLCILTSPYGFL